MLNEHSLENQRYLNIKLLANYIGFKEATVRDWVRLKKIPYLKVGKGIRFDIKRIDDWLERKQVEN